MTTRLEKSNLVTDVSEIYCLKCRKFTPNKEVRTEAITTKGSERKIQKTECFVCGKRKNRFIKNEPK